MINILRFSICVLFQTSSKWQLKKQQTGTSNLTKQTASSAGETFALSKENWIQNNYFLQKVFGKKHWKVKPHQAKGFIRRRNFHNIRRKLHKKELWRLC